MAGLGLLSFMCGLTVLGLSSSVLAVFLSGAAGGAAKLADTVLRSLVSQAVQDHEIGKVFGVVAVQGGKL